MKKDKYGQLASTKSVEMTKKSLEKNGFTVEVVKNGGEAFKKVFSLIPKGAEVMTATSKTLETLKIDEKINESGKYNSIKSQLLKLDREKDSLIMQKLGAAPEYVIGSVHAVTTDGKVIIASGTGSQLPAYSYGATHVIWVISTKKITSNLEDGIKRIYDYVLPLEDVRVKQVYGPMAISEVRKLLIINKEIDPNRVTIIFVPEDLGF